MKCNIIFHCLKKRKGWVLYKQNHIQPGAITLTHSLSHALSPPFPSLSLLFLSCFINGDKGNIVQRLSVSYLLCWKRNIWWFDRQTHKCVITIAVVNISLLFCVYFSIQTMLSWWAKVKINLISLNQICHYRLLFQNGRTFL